jgi:flagellar biosynthesis protein FlhF
MVHMASRFSSLVPERLMFTGMDEASSTAPMIETLIRTRIPATFVGTGQQIPRDLKELNPERLARYAWLASTSQPGPGRAGDALAAA